MNATVQTITADRYELSPHLFSAGTRGSVGVSRMQFELSSDWDGLTTYVVFFPRRGSPVNVPYLGEPIDIPAEIMAYAGVASYVLSGVVFDAESGISQKMISLGGNLEVEFTRSTGSGNTRKVTPDTYDLFLDEAKEYMESVLRAAQNSGGNVSDEAIAEAVDRYFDENPIEVPVKTSDLQNDSGFITKAVSDLVNYYTKSQTYTQSEINAMVSAIPKFTISVVSALPTSGISNTTVYLLSGGVSGNLYTEYIYVNGVWEILGSQRVDLDGYVTDEMLTQALQDYVKNTEFAALAETVDVRMIPTYVLQEGETVDDAPEWADEIIDPHSEPESEPGGDVDLSEVNARLDKLSKAIAEQDKVKVDATEVVAPLIVGTAIAQKCAEFSALMRDTERVESFIFFTDPHLLAAENGYEEEFREYIRILKAYYSATPTSFVVCGGDWLELHNRSEACFRLGYVDGYMRNNFDRYYSVVGNHDHNTNSSGVSYPEEADVGVLPINTVKNLMMRDEEHTYYTFDGSNTTFYVLDSGPQWYNMTAHMWEQIEWLAGKLKSKDTENSAIIVHAAYEAEASSGEIVLQEFMTNTLALCQAYNEATTITLNGKDYDFTGCKGRMRFVLSGHKHGKDFQEVVGDIPVVRTTNMRAGNTPTFELCLADYKRNKLHLVRVGSGNSRIVELTSAPQPYPDETMVLLIGKEAPGASASGITTAPASYAEFFGTIDTGVKYTDSETGVDYFAMLKPEGATKVTMTSHDAQIIFLERGYTGGNAGKDDWAKGVVEYNFQSDAWFYLVKVRDDAGKDLSDNIMETISWSFGGYSNKAYTNQIRSSIGTDGIIYNGIGYKPRTRIGTGSGAEVEHTTYSATGFIPAKSGDTFRTKNISTTSESAVSLWDENFNFITASYLNEALYTVDENGVLSGKVYRNNAAYIRITGQFFNNPIVTVNEEIV